MNKFRLIKAKLQSGRWDRKYFNNETQLEQYLKENNPAQVYISIWSAKNPILIDKLKQEQKLSQMAKDFITSEILIELDSPNNMPQGEKQQQEISHWLTTFYPQIKQQKICSAGGYYLVCTTELKESTPIKNFIYLNNLRNKLLHEIYCSYNKDIPLEEFIIKARNRKLKISKGDFVDYKVCIDPWRVRRLEGTFNTTRQKWAIDMKNPRLYRYHNLNNTPAEGNKCVFDSSHLRKPNEAINSPAARMPVKANDTTRKGFFHPAKTIVALPKQVRKPTSIHGIRSKIDGTKNKAIPFFTFKRYSSSVKRKLIEAMRIYNLSTGYVINSYKGVAVLFLDALPRDRLTKIYKFLQPLNRQEFEHFGNCFIEVYHQFDNQIVNIWFSIGYLLAPKSQGSTLSSKPHKYILKEITQIFPDKRPSVGLVRPILYKKVISNAKR